MKRAAILLCTLQVGCVTWTSVEPRRLRVPTPAGDVKRAARLIVTGDVIFARAYSVEIEALARDELTKGGVQAVSGTRAVPEIDMALRFHDSAVVQITGMAMVMTLGIFPAFGTVDFDIEVTMKSADGRMLKSYKYNVSKGVLAGLLFLPFSWVTLMTDSMEDKFRSVIRDFLAVSQRDGLWVEASFDKREEAGQEKPAASAGGGLWHPARHRERPAERGRHGRFA